MSFFRWGWGDRIHTDCKCFESQPTPNPLNISSVFAPLPTGRWCEENPCASPNHFEEKSQPRPSPLVISWGQGPPRRGRWCEGRPALQRAPPPCGSLPWCSQGTQLMLMWQPHWLCSLAPLPRSSSAPFYFPQTFGLTALLPVPPSSCGQEPENWNLNVINHQHYIHRSPIITNLNMPMKTMMTMPAMMTGKRPEKARAAIARSVLEGT